ncbi:MAG: NlpC/P60 family protein [Oscillospiraceae bacterium]|nr:NlpC/P60 family protein [Oscillospiraceae bacterium]
MKKKFKTAFMIMLLTLAIAFILSGCAGGTISVKESDEKPEPKPPVSSGEKPDNSDNSKSAPPNTEKAPLQSVPPVSKTPAVSGTETDNSETPLNPAVENQIAQTAKSLIGLPFKDGGDSPSAGFDNSGFIYYVLRANGYVNCPRVLSEQANMGNKIDSVSELEAGDLVFFSENREKAQFGGIYIGDGIMISCRMPGENVREFDITSGYYKNSFFTGVRVL